MNGRVTAVVPDDRLLAALLELYWAEGVTQAKAARLLGIRKAEFAELADLRMVTEALERAAWRYFEECFNYRFPECDLRCATVKTLDAWKYRVPPKGATENARAYDGKPRDAHAKEPSPRECRLLEPPQRRTMREVVPRPAKPDADVARYLLTHRAPLWKRFPDLEELTGPESELQSLQCV